MTRLIDDIKRVWRGEQQPSLTWSCLFAAVCLIAATAVRYGMAHLRPDVFFTPYMPAVFFATAMGGSGVGLATAIIGAGLGLMLDFGGGPADGARLALMAMYLTVAALVIWGVNHYRSLAAKQREIARRLTEEEQYRKLLVDELHHRLKNKTSTIHAVLHQVLHDQPQVWGRIDQRIRALATADDLIARADAQGCDLKDLLMSELGPYGHVRFELNGDPLFLPAKLAVSLALIFHELATNAGKYGAFASPRGFLQVSWTMQDDRLKLTWDEAEGPPINHVGKPGFGTKLLKAALSSFDGKTETTFLATGIHCTMQCRVPPS
ncbi:sensor histidine kinase [Bradyrhizobium sp. 83002]|uniref:sensor histidine kinase n=1 Tax=Bradyrhizobium aeschynomenes TaxID=2734909 RepID=UPI0015563723|nr:sensor histidine kinase [Bradyrhizobium aeschynomenes]NPU11991.1 sensor histidine kinase [Bradyrhizobium aeschynomenes]